MCALLTEGRNRSIAVIELELFKTIFTLFRLLSLPTSRVTTALIVCPPFALTLLYRSLLYTPGVVLRPLDWGWSPLSWPALWRSPHAPSLPIREGVNWCHCQRPFDVVTPLPRDKAGWCAGNLQTIAQHNRFDYHLFAHSHTTVFSNNCSQGKMTPIISVQLTQYLFCHFHLFVIPHGPHGIVDCKPALLIVMKTSTISKLITALTCFIFN